MRALSLLLVLVCNTSWADESPARRGQVESLRGALLNRRAGDASWQMLAAGAPVGERLLTLPGHVATLAHAGVRLQCYGGMPDPDATPYLGTLLQVHPPGELAWNLALDHGRVLITSADAEPRALRLHLGKQQVELRLLGRAEVAVEASSYWPRGTPLAPRPKEGLQPRRPATLMLLAGKIELTCEQETQTLSHRTLFRWADTPGKMEGPLPLAKTPAWLDAPLDGPKARLENAVAGLYLNPLVTLDVGLAKLKQLEAPLAREAAIWNHAALDQLAAVLAELQARDSQDARLAALHALRLYAGCSPQHVLAVREALTKQKYSAAHADIALYLLNGLSAEDCQRPESYDALIRYLVHEQVGIRQLAAWNLAALVPAGRQIRYDAAAADGELARAQGDWRKIIPEGKLPAK